MGCDVCFRPRVLTLHGTGSCKEFQKPWGVKFKGGGGGGEPETLRRHPRQYIFMIGFSFITLPLTAWDRSKLPRDSPALANLQTSERKKNLASSMRIFVPNLTQMGEKAWSSFFSCSGQERLEGEEERAKKRTVPCMQRNSKRWPPSSKATGTQLFGEDLQVSFLSFPFLYFPFLFSFPFCFFVFSLTWVIWRCQLMSQVFCGLASASELTRCWCRGSKKACK